MELQTVIIGTGLSSLSFIDKYLEKNKKIDIISPDKDFLYDSNGANIHLLQNLPYHIIKNKNKINNYFESNNITVNKSSKILGILGFGGLSNYWGMQIDNNILDDIKYLSSKTRKDIIDSFFEILRKFKLKGNCKLKNKEYLNNYKVDAFFNKLLKKKFNDLLVSKPILAYSKKRKLTADLYLRRYINKKKIKIYNLSVQEIFYNKNKITIKCVDANKKEKVIFAKKVIFGCGTIVTTKIILKFLKIKNEVKIKHHPRLVSAFFSKRKIQNLEKLQASQLNIRSKSKVNSFIIDLRTGNETIVESVIRLKKFLMPFKFILNLFKNHLIFSNILLDSKFSNLFIKVSKNKTYIYSKKSNLEEILRKIHISFLRILKQENLVFPFSNNFFGGYGNDFHYFGTIPMSKNKKKLSVNENCQLNGYPNIYIIDGSVLDFKENKYPVGLVMANARRVAKIFK